MLLFPCFKAVDQGFIKMQRKMDTYFFDFHVPTTWASILKISVFSFSLFFYV